MSRHFYGAAGWLAVALGLIGVLLPLLPTVPFMILAAFLFARGSPRARAWLVDHAQFGPHIRRWERTGGISRRAKVLAVASMAAAIGVTMALGMPVWVLAVQGGCMLLAALFVLSRPDGGDGA